MKRIDYKLLFSESLISQLNELQSELKKVDSILSDMAKSTKIELLGGAKTLKQNEKSVKELVKLLEEKQKVEQQNKKLQEQIAKLEAKKAKEAAKAAKEEEKRIKQEEQLRKNLAENLTEEERMIQTLEIKRDQLKQIAKESGRTSKAYITQAAEVRKLSKEVRQSTREQELKIAMDTLEEGSINKLRTKKGLLAIQVGRLTEEQRENTEEGRKLVNQLKETNQEIIDFDTSVKDGRSSVGLYADSLSAFGDSLGGIREEFSVLSPLIAKIGNKLEEQANKWKEAKEQARETRGETKKNATALKGLGKIAGAVGVAGLATFFLKTADGFEKLRLMLAKARGFFLPFLAALGGIGREIVARFNVLSANFTGFFKNIGLQAKKFALETSQFLADALTFNIGGKKIELFKTADSKKQLEEVNNEIKALEQRTKEANEELEKSKVNFEGLFQQGKNTAEVFEGIEQGKINSEKLNRALRITVSELDKQRQLLEDIGEDDTLNFSRRRKAAEDSAKVASESADIALKMSNKQIELLQKEQAELEKLGLKDSDIREQITETVIARNVLEQEYIEVLRNNSEFRKKAISDELEVDLDANLQSFENRKANAEKIIANEKVSFETRRQLLKQLEANEAAFYAHRIDVITQNSKEAARIELERIEKEIELLKRKGKLSEVEQRNMNRLVETRKENQDIIAAEIDLTEILAETDAKRMIELVRGLKLGEKWELRTLEVLREKQAATRDLAGLQKDLSDEYISGAENQFAIQAALIELLRGQVDENGKLIVSNEELYSRQIEAEKSLLQAQLDRFKQYRAESLTDEQIAEMQALQIEIEKLGKGMKDLENFVPPPTLFDKLFESISKGFEGTEEGLDFWKGKTQEALNTIADSTFQFLSNINAARQDDLSKEIEKINEELEEKQALLDIEKQRAEEGKANNLDVVQSEVDTLETAEEKKREELEKTQETQNQIAAAQLALNGIITASNLILAASEIFKANSGIPLVGVAVAGAAVATMLATIAGVRKQVQGFHDGTESVQGPAGRDNAGVFKLEKDERVLTAKQNRQIPRSVKNKDVPMLIQLGLGKVNADEKGLSLLSINQEVKENSGDDILLAIHKALVEQEDVIDVGGRALTIQRKNGKIFRKTWG